MAQNNPCSVDGCDKPRHGLLYCAAHRHRWERHGDPLGGKHGKVSDNPCAVAGCGEAAFQRDWCRSHYMRWYRYGDPEAGRRRVGSPPDPCSIEGCPRAAKVKGMCSRHYDANWRNGCPQRPCETCGQEVRASRRYCSDECKPHCHIEGCGRPADRLGSLCYSHYASGRAHGTTARQLADRDGACCSLCGGIVDMTLKRADSLMCPSVDHIIPRSLGGTNDPANLALAHLLCNIRKSNRVA